MCQCHPANNIPVATARYIVEKQHWLVSCPACGHSWHERPITIQGSHHLIIEDVTMATACPACNQPVDVIAPLYEVAEVKP